MRVTLQNLSSRRLNGALARRAVEAVLAEHSAPEGRVVVAFLPDEEMRALNLRHRGVDRATDVLSFAAEPEVRLATGVLGDIAVSEGFAARGALARGVSLSQEAAYLALHGALHLAGWNDESDEERSAMQGEMNRIAGLVGLKPDPDWESQPYENGVG